VPYDPLSWIEDQLSRLDQSGLRRTLIQRGGSQTPRKIVAGREYINFAANDYLALAADPRITSAVSAALPQTGWGAGASPVVTGRGSLHAELEARIALFEGAEAALLLSSGYTANLGEITALMGRGDILFSDAKNHASIIDGARLSKAEIVIYQHGQVDDLRSHLAAAPQKSRKLIATDSLFSMDGDLAPLAEISQLAEEFDAMLLIDEAHATGVFGKHGKGAAEYLAAEHPAHIRVGTLSKALGSCGGFVSGEQRLIDYLANRARSYVFSTAPAEAIAAAGIAALDIVRDEPERRVDLLKTAATFRARLAEQGHSTGDSESQIIPLIIGEPLQTMQFSEKLKSQGLFVPGIRPPTVVPGASRLRISLCHGHQSSDLERLLAALSPNA